jgi:hypothetical protein
VRSKEGRHTNGHQLQSTSLLIDMQSSQDWRTQHRIRLTGSSACPTLAFAGVADGSTTDPDIVSSLVACVLPIATPLGIHPVVPRTYSIAVWDDRRPSGTRDVRACPTTPPALVPKRRCIHTWGCSLRAVMTEETRCFFSFKTMLYIPYFDYLTGRCKCRPKQKEVWAVSFQKLRQQASYADPIY